MKIAVVAPSGVPFVRGGAENLWWGLVESLNEREGIMAELIKIPSPERNLTEIIHSYIDFARLDLLHFDQVISTKYPAWAISHPNHVVYMQHKLRGLYDTYPAQLPTDIPSRNEFPRQLQALHDHLLNPPDSRECLAEIIRLLLEFLAWRDRLPADWYVFPGAMSRAIVHMLDHVCLADGVDRYCAISHAVARRENYFPAKADVEVFYHPTSLKGLHSGQQKYFFTASRLDRPKRIDLIIRAWQQAGVSYPLYIAGSGPCDDELRQVARENPDIVFLGYITDEQLTDYYADALAVIFVPEQEDYGLITLEAMLAGKPVITVDDAGGVTELVRDRENGWIAAANADDLAKVLQTCAKMPEQALIYGKSGKAWAETVSWYKLQAFLVVRLRRKLLVLNTFSVFPPVSGGQLRIYNLYRWLARELQVVLVTPAPASQPGKSVSIAPGFREIRVPRTIRFEKLEHKLSSQLGVSAGDVAALRYHTEMPEWAGIIAQEVSDADWVVLSHPYAYFALKSVYEGDFLYESHNMEFDLKQAMFAAKGDPKQYATELELVEEAERACVAQSVQFIACTSGDRERLQEHFGVADKGVIVRNGVSVDAIPFKSLEERLAVKSGNRMTALFLGSLHLPNIQALEFIHKIAPVCDNVDFFIAGSVCHAFDEHKKLPDNLKLLGVVSDEEKLNLLTDCEISLNPMMTGSGSNLKILEAAASGQLIVSTHFGGRGGVLLDGQDYIGKDLQEIPDFLRSLTVQDLTAYTDVVNSARRQVERLADWKKLAEDFRRALPERD